jgi:hypothetical protein
MRPYSPTQTIGLSPTAKTKNAAKAIPGIKPFAPSAIFIALTKPTAKMVQRIQPTNGIASR